MSALPLSLAFLLLFHACLALQQISQNQCRIQRINALEPYGRVQAEAGVTVFFDSDEQQLQCTGVEFIRHRIQPQGLLLPLYLSTPFMFYILQGRGDFGMMVPGCPETYQSSQQMQERGSFQDRHQKIRQFRQGDVIVIPAGVAYWMYNNGEEEIVAVALLDSTNEANQLDQYHRRFFLAGKPQQSQQQEHEDGAGNVFRGFDVQMLAEAFNIDQQTAEKLQSRDDRRGHIVRVERGLQVIRPPTGFEQQEYEGRRHGSPSNGYEETICSAKVIHNLNEPSRADFFNPEAGWSTQLNSFKLPVLQMVQLSAERGVLKRNAMMSPYWMMNAHDIVYVTRGNMKMQIVNNEGQAVFDDVIQEGQLVVVPQNFVVAKRAGNEGCEWISFRTNDNAMISALSGMTSTFLAMPVDVLAKAYQLSPEQAWELKNNRQEKLMFGPSSARH